MQPSVEFGGIKLDECGILLPSCGLYQVTYGVAVEDSCGIPARFQLVFGGAGGTCALPGSALSVGSPRTLGTVSTLVSAQDRSYIQIQNVSIDSSGAPTPVVLNGNGGVSAFINIIKLR